LLALLPPPFRLGAGLLHEGEGAVFTDIAYEIPLIRLIQDGYLVPLVSKSAENQADLSKIRTKGGEFVQHQAAEATDDAELTRSAIEECLRLASDRKSWLVFCASVEHAQHVRDMLRSYGKTSEVITGETPKAQRARILAAFKRGEIDSLTNCDVLTTGTDVPRIDLIVLLRPPPPPPPPPD
jgi:DNA repair protein RadD